MVKQLNDIIANIFLNNHLQYYNAEDLTYSTPKARNVLSAQHDSSFSITIHMQLP